MFGGGLLPACNLLWKAELSILFGFPYKLADVLMRMAYCACFREEASWQT